MVVDWWGAGQSNETVAAVIITYHQGLAISNDQVLAIMCGHICVAKCVWTRLCGQVCVDTVHPASTVNTVHIPHHLVAGDCGQA